VTPFFSRRRKTYVNSRVQGRFIGRIAAYWVMYHVVLWHGLFVYRYAQVRMSAGDGQVIGPFRSVYWQFCIDYSPLLICALLIMPLFMLDFVRMTHRFVGPLVRIRESLVGLMDRRPVSRIEFRNGDLLPELQATFNDFLSFYEQQRLHPQSSGKQAGCERVMSESQAQALSAVLPAERAAEPAAAAV
jgi:hypothetical protein